MGIKSTYSLSRILAIDILDDYNYDKLSDEQLENLLECLEESHYRNYTIDDDDEFCMRIKTKKDFDAGY